MPKIAIPTALRRYANEQAAVTVEGTTIKEALASMTAQYPDLQKHLFDGEGKLRSFVNVYVNDEDIRYQQQDDTPVSENDDIAIIPSIAGGSGAESKAAEAELLGAQARGDLPSFGSFYRGDKLYELNYRQRQILLANGNPGFERYRFLNGVGARLQ